MSFPVIRPEDVADLPDLAIRALLHALRIECREAAARHQALVYARRQAAAERPVPPPQADPPGTTARRRAVLAGYEPEGAGVPHLVAGVWKWGAA